MQRSWLHPLRKRTPPTIRRGQDSIPRSGLLAKLEFERLEDRLAPVTTTVTNTNDSGAGSLRQAIVDANATRGADTISFAIGGSGVRTINLTSALPAITDQITINGHTQPGASANTLAVGNNAVLLIELNGSGTSSATGPTLNPGAAGSRIRGLVLNHFGVGIDVGVGSTTIAGNFIGTDASGTVIAGNNFQGIRLNGASNTTIGGTTPAARNLISGNNASAGNASIEILGPAATGNVVQGNYIGTNKNGTAVHPNSNAGVSINGGVGAASGNLIGGTAAGAGNVIHDACPLHQGERTLSLLRSAFRPISAAGVIVPPPPSRPPRSGRRWPLCVYVKNHVGIMPLPDE